MCEIAGEIDCRVCKSSQRLGALPLKLPQVPLLLDTVASWTFLLSSLGRNLGLSVECST